MCVCVCVCVCVCERALACLFLRVSPSVQGDAYFGLSPLTGIQQNDRCNPHDTVTRQVAVPGAVGIRKGGMEQLAEDPLNPDLGAR